jgi:citrate synthase
MAQIGEPRALTVEDLMSRPVVTSTPSESVATAAARMWEAGVGSVVVVDDDRAVGILTERDLVRCTSEGVDPAAVTVADWMTPDPSTIEPGVAAAEAFARLGEHGYRHIPVVAGDELAGIVSMRDLLRVARITPVEARATELPKGLEGVEVAETALGDVRGRQGFYHYRQYDAIELARKRTLEDVWFLLYDGRLPDKAERNAFADEIRGLRAIPDSLIPALENIVRSAPDASLLSCLQAAYSLLVTTENLQPILDTSAEELRAQALRTCAVLPTLISALHRIRSGESPVAPHATLPYASNYLFMMTGEEPKPEHARAVEMYLIATIDHGFNASTFTARVITSTGADLGSAVLGALGAFSGPLHGGAPSRALDMLHDIGSKENADKWLRNEVESGRRLMGFGHRVYKTDDPRSVMLREVAEELDGDIVELAKFVEKRAVEILEEMKPGRALYPNVEFYAGIVLDMIGMPRALFTPTFGVSRVIGWTAHIMEQAAANRLIRPAAHYTGPEPPEDVPEIA